MLKALIRILLVSFTGVFITSCIQEPSVEIENVKGYKPIYAEQMDSQIEFGSPRLIDTPGKIYVYANYLFVNERGEGVHVINNANPASPVNMAFLKIPGNVDIAVREYVLYADSFSDLVAIDISDIRNPKVCDIERNVFNFFQEYPNVTGVYFECVDNSKGVVIAWEQTTLEKPNCYR